MKRFISWVCKVFKINLIDRDNISETESYRIYLESLVPELKGVDSEKLFDEIKPGDIIMALTNCSTNELVKLGESHRRRPYIVAKKERGVIYGFCGTSNLKQKYKKSFELSSREYNVKKNGIINIGNAIALKKEKIVSKIDELTNKDICEINRTIRLNCTTNVIIDKKIEITEGSIVSRGKNDYYLYSIENNSVKLFEFARYKTDVSIKIDNTIEYIDLNRMITDHINNGFIKINELDEDYNKELKNRIENILEQKELEKRKIVVRNEVNNIDYEYEVGSIFYSGFERFIYLYSLNGYDYGVYFDGSISLYPSIKRIDNFDYYWEDDMLDDYSLDVLLYRLASNQKYEAIINKMLGDELIYEEA